MTRQLAKVEQTISSFTTGYRTLTRPKHSSQTRPRNHRDRRSHITIFCRSGEKQTSHHPMIGSANSAVAKDSESQSSQKCKHLPRHRSQPKQYKAKRNLESLSIPEAKHPYLAILTPACNTTVAQPSASDRPSMSSKSPLTLARPRIPDFHHPIFRARYKT